MNLYCGSMSKSGPIVVVEDDQDDQFIMEKIFQQLATANPRHYFTNCHDAYAFLQTTSKQPCVIISDVNLPRMGGLEFKKMIDQNPLLRQRGIPFVFLSTSTDQKSVNEAYATTTLQGFFQKPDTYEELIEIIELIMNYWLIGKHPGFA